MQSRLAALCCALATFWLTPVAAQQQPNNAHPANPRAAVPTTPYQSAFTGYQSFRDEKLSSWREVNDEAGRIGGHHGMIIYSGGEAHADHSAAPKAPRATNGKGRPEMMK